MRRIGERYAKWQIGDLLWVKETWAVNHCFDARKPSEITSAAHVHYAANSSFGGNHNLGGLLVRPSLFMPQLASRTWLEIVDIRQEPIQEITEIDAVAEGLEPWRGGWCPWAGDTGPWFASPIGAFKHLWDYINPPSDEVAQDWDSNPLVWRIEFQKVAAP